MDGRTLMMIDYLMKTLTKMFRKYTAQSAGKDAQRFPNQASVSDDQNAGLVEVGRVLTGSVKKCLHR
jgi:hypothetical protein